MSGFNRCRILLMVFACLFSSLSISKTLLIGTSNYAPYIYKDKDGLSQEIARAAFKAVDVDVKFEVYPLVRLIKYFDEKKVSHAMYAPEALSTHLAASSVPIHNVLTILAYNNKKHKNLDFKVLKGLAGMKVGTIAGDVAYINMLKSEGLIPDAVKQPEQNMRKLDKGRIDVADLTYLTTVFLKKKMFADGGEHISIIPTRTGSYPVSLIFAKDDAQSMVNLEFSKGLKIIHENGVYKSILEKYFGGSEVPADVYVDMK